jgi:hypothetical protein
MPNATRRVTYGTLLHATGGTAPYRWKAISPLLKGFRLHRNGKLSGKPSLAKTQEGMFALTVQATTKASKGTPGQTVAQMLTLTIV